MLHVCIPRTHANGVLGTHHFANRDIERISNNSRQTQVTAFTVGEESDEPIMKRIAGLRTGIGNVAVYLARGDAVAHRARRWTRGEKGCSHA